MDNTYKRSDNHIQELLKLIPDISMEYGQIICKCKLVNCVYMDKKSLDKIKMNKQGKCGGDKKTNDRVLR